MICSGALKAATTSEKLRIAVPRLGSHRGISHIGQNPEKENPKGDAAPKPNRPRRRPEPEKPTPEQIPCKNQKAVLSLTRRRIETRHRETAVGEPKREEKILIWNSP